jgi:hypothetical protein
MGIIEGDVLKEDEESLSDSDFESVCHTGGIRMVTLAKDKKRSLITDNMVSLSYRFASIHYSCYYHIMLSFRSHHIKR